QAEAAYPDHFWVVYELGLALYYMRNDQVGALSYFRAATAIKPEHHFVRYETGQCLMRLGKFVESLREFELAFEHSPERGMLEHQTYLRYGVLQAIGGALILAEKGDIELPIAERKKLARKALPRFTHEVDRLEQLLRQGGPKVNAYYEELQLIPKYPVFSVFREHRKLAYLDEPGEQDQWDRLWKRIQDLEKQLQPRKK
ncbi:MAG: tetratricopeptide repeat protein, partial [Gemmataceae bacterium]